jgi:hypothetical protein
VVPEWGWDHREPTVREDPVLIAWLRWADPAVGDLVEDSAVGPEAVSEVDLADPAVAADSAAPEVVALGCAVPAGGGREDLVVLEGLSGRVAPEPGHSVTDAATLAVFTWAMPASA